MVLGFGLWWCVRSCVFRRYPPKPLARYENSGNPQQFGIARGLHTIVFRESLGKNAVLCGTAFFRMLIGKHLAAPHH